MSRQAMVLALALAGCPKQPLVAPLPGGVPVVAETATAPLVGTWQGEDGRPVYRIEANAVSVSLVAWDSADGERFQIANLRLEGGDLLFTSIMPSTGWTLDNSLHPAGDGTLRHTISGAAEGVFSMSRSGEQPPTP